jgi:DNA-binding MarR family transcriptional regulator
MARSKQARSRDASMRERDDGNGDSLGWPGASLREQRERDASSQEWREQMGSVREWGRATREGYVLWLGARRWRRCVDAALASAMLSFTQWLVLDATAYLTEETADCVSQNQVAARLELDRMSISSAMSALDRRSLVSRGGAMSGRSWRVFVTAEGIALLNAWAEKVEAALSAA